MTVGEFTPFLRLHPRDNVAIARRGVDAGTVCDVCTNSGDVIARESIGMGHKLAISQIKKGEPIVKFGQIVGFASRSIRPGDAVHEHNVTMGDLDLDYAYATEVPETPKGNPERTFQGYRRANGKAGTRNYIGIISTVNCSATASKAVARRLREFDLSDYPNIDGVVALVHERGCAMEFNGVDHRQLNRTLAGFANHPNIAACIVLGLGCETAQPSSLVESHQLTQLNVPGQPDQPNNSPIMMTIQETGGTQKAIDRATGVLRELLTVVNNVKREPIPVGELIMATECGGSDGSSGVTSNPAVGMTSDLLVAHGGTAILSETPEICGAEHLLTRRARTAEIGQKLIERVKWWYDYASKFGVVINNNPSVGNKLGGLTTIYEKSLGAVAKGGSTSLNAVYEYAEEVTEKGLVFMDTPGFDPPSVTGMVAGGANVVVFTTGRGSCFGCKPVPSIKVASNTPMYRRMIDDMDINAGTIADETGASVEEVGREIFEKVIAVASGKKTKSELQEIGDEEFSPWTPGPIL